MELEIMSGRLAGALPTTWTEHWMDMDAVGRVQQRHQSAEIAFLASALQQRHALLQPHAASPRPTRRMPAGMRTNGVLIDFT